MKRITIKDKIAKSIGRRYIERYTHDQVSFLGIGEFSIVYRSQTDTNIVYILSEYNDAAKEVIMHLDGVHSPNNELIDTFEYRDQGFIIYRSQYTQSPTKNDTKAWNQLKTLRKLYKPYQYFHWHNTTKWHIYMQEFISSLENNAEVDQSLYEALDILYSWATAYSPTFAFEFSPRNTAVNHSTGDLILRDVIFFRETNNREYR